MDGHEWIDGQRQMNGQTDGQMDRQTDGQRDGPTE